MLAKQQQENIGGFLQHLEQSRRRDEGSIHTTPVHTNNDKFRLDVLKQKEKTTESAVASPEVIIHSRLQETFLSLLT